MRQSLTQGSADSVPASSLLQQQLRVYSHSLPLLTTHHRPPTFASLFFSCTYKSLFHPDRFAGPLFPHTYKPLFPQPLSFHMYTKPRGCRGIHLVSSPAAPSPAESGCLPARQAGLSVEKRPNSFPDIPLRTLEISLPSFATSRPLFSIVCALFLQNRGVWGSRPRKTKLVG